MGLQGYATVATGVDVNFFYGMYCTILRHSLLCLDNSSRLLGPCEKGITAP